MSMNQNCNQVIRRTRRRIGVVCASIAVLSLATGCAVATAQTSPTGLSDVEYQIYSLVLDTAFSEVTRDTFYVHETTSSARSESLSDIVPRILRLIPSVSSELIEAYVAANADTLQLAADRFQTQFPVVLISSGQGLARGGSRIYLSRIGFSADGSEAVVHYMHSCGSRCGGGYVTRLEKVDGSWVFKEGMETMIS